MDVTDRELIEKLKSGDDDAWRDVSEHLLNLATKILSKYPAEGELEEEAAETANEAAELILDNLDQCRKAFWPWAEQILRSVISRKPLVKRRRLARKALQRFLEHLPEEEPELKTKVLQVIDDLPRPHRAQLKLMIGTEKRRVKGWRARARRDQAMWELLNNKEFMDALHTDAGKRSRRARKVVDRYEESKTSSYLQLIEEPEEKVAPEIGGNLLVELLRLNSTENLVIRQRFESALAKCLGQLRWEYREVVEKRYFDGLTQVEIAEEMGRPNPTIRTWHRRALFELKDCLRKWLEA